MSSGPRNRRGPTTKQQIDMKLMKNHEGESTDTPFMILHELHVSLLLPFGFGLIAAAVLGPRHS